MKRINPPAPPTKSSVALSAAEAIGSMVTRGSKGRVTPPKASKSKKPTAPAAPAKKVEEKKIEKKPSPKRAPKKAEKIVNEEPMKNKSYYTASGVKVTDKRQR